MVLTILCLAAATAAACDADNLSIMPWPQKVSTQAGAFTITPNTRICANSASSETARFLAARLRNATGYPLNLTSAKTIGRGNILLTTEDANTNFGPEGYALTITPNAVVVRAPTQAGLFYGAQTLLQLLPPEIFSTNQMTHLEWQMPCVQIQDWPRFRWRGLLLDTSRHFFTKVEIERLLDAMAGLKMNVFHWHLTDDQGWRIEIEKYPKLTQIGAWRPGVGFGLDPKSTTAYGPDGRYGGFYTAADIREVVKYAAARHITIVPEIEMPGHSTAALAAYPQFSCTGLRRAEVSTVRASAGHKQEETSNSDKGASATQAGGPFTIPLTNGVFNGIYNPANPATFTFLDEVLNEVFQLFPGRYVHLGGDEVPPETWEHSPACQALMKREGLTNEDELQGWFMRRTEIFVSAHGRTMIGWSEILKGGLASNAVVMDWIGGAKEAALAGHDVVMSPVAYCYLDFYQSTNYAAEPKAASWAKPLTLREVYSFDPMPADLPPQLQSHILGTQGNLWTEWVPNLKHAEYMMFPRLTALAEVSWSSPSTRDFDNFNHRLQTEFQRFDKLCINYRPGAGDAPTAASAQ